MSSRTDRLQVIFEVAGDGKLKAALGQIGALGDDAAGRLDHAASASDRLNAAAKRAGAILGGSLVLGLGLIIKNTIEAERVDAQLEARLKSTAGAAGMTKQALDDLATATARKTTFDDESIKSTEAMLLTFTRIHADVFPKALEAVTNMSVAMGTDLEGAAIQVGKALNDPILGISALSRVGVTFTEDQKKVIKALVDTGRVADAQKIILKELATEFGGAAEAARGTFGGALAALKNTLDDLTEGSSGSLEGATGAVNDLTHTLNDPAVQAGFAAIVSGVASVTSEVFQGIGILAQYLQKYRDIANIGDGSLKLPDAGEQALNSRLGAVGSTIRNIEKGGIGGKFAAVYGSESALSGGDLFRPTSAVLADLKKERTAIIRQMTANIKSELGSESARAGFDLGLPGSKSSFLSFNFAADQVSRAGVPIPQASGKPAKGGGAKGGTKSRGMPDFYDRAKAEIDAEVAAIGRADDEYAKMAATLSGPLAEAQYQYKQNLLHITEIEKKTTASAEEIGALREKEKARFEAETAAIADRANPAAQLLKDLQFEYDLLGMTNAQRETAIDLRRLDGQATAEQAAALEQMHQAYEDQARAISGQIEGMDAARDSVKGFFEDVRHGANAWDAAKKALDSFADKLLSMIEDNLIGQLMGQQGTQGGGSSGGWITSLLGGLFGGGSGGGGFGGMFSSGWGDAGSFAGVDITGQGFAQGGHTDGSQARQVAEFGKPELFRANGRTWLLPGSAGQVVPMGAGMPGNAGRGERGDNYAITVNVPRNTSYQTAQQAGQAAYAGAARAARRNG